MTTHTTEIPADARQAALDRYHAGTACAWLGDTIGTEGQAWRDLSHRLDRDEATPLDLIAAATACRTMVESMQDHERGVNKARAKFTAIAARLDAAGEATRTDSRTVSVRL